MREWERMREWMGFGLGDKKRLWLSQFLANTIIKQSFLGEKQSTSAGDLVPTLSQSRFACSILDIKQSFFIIWKYIYICIIYVNTHTHTHTHTTKKICLESVSLPHFIYAIKANGNYWFKVGVWNEYRKIFDKKKTRNVRKCYVLNKDEDSIKFRLT